VAEAAREAELARAVSAVLGLAGEVEEVGVKLAFTFWGQQGALTLLDYREEQQGSGRVGRPIDKEELARVLRLVFSEYVGPRTGETVLTLRREEARWGVGTESSSTASRPPEAKTLPVRAQGTSADTFLSLHSASKEWLRTVQLETGAPHGWNSPYTWRTGGSPGGSCSRSSARGRDKAVHPGRCRPR
jgi:hypothetical protein